MLEARWSISLLSKVNWVSCLREYCLPHSVFLSEELQLFQNRPIELSGEFTAALVREPLMLEARGCSPFFSIVNSVRCFKEYCPPLSFHGEEHHLCALKPLSGEGSIHCTSSKKSMNVTSWRANTLFYDENWVTYIKEFCLSLSVFMGEECPLCCIELKKVHGRSALPPVSRCQGLKQGLLAHCFPVRIELACERNACETKAF
jgi:hypothetical protein